MTITPPRVPSAHEIGALVECWNAGDLAQCEQLALSMIRRCPDHFAAWKALGLILLNTGRVGEAIDPLRHWARLQPGDVDAHINLGSAYKDIGLIAEAGMCFIEALDIQPDFAELQSNVGSILRELGYPAKAQQHFLEALRLKPSYAEAHSNLGNALCDTGRYAEAEACYRTALRLQPDLINAHSNLLYCQNFLAALPIDTVLADARRFGALISSRAVPKFTSWRSEPNPDRLRIGFVSGDFVNHPVGYFTEALFTHLESEGFELYAFSANPKSDALTDRIKPRFCEWVPIFALPDLAAATVIHQRGIDILIDLSGHTAKNRLPVFAYRPAPVQVTWLGYFATTGLPEMDIILGDPVMVPDGSECEFTEIPRLLPETWLCLAQTPDLPVGALPAMSSGRITFGYFGKQAKLNEDVVRTWAEVLRAIPDARLFFNRPELADEALAAQVRQKFGSHGVGEERIELAGNSTREEYLGNYQRVDIVLDTFPYPGGTTSVEALWMGVPVLTLQGDRFLGRLGCSIARNAGQADWIARDRDDYVAKAIALSSDLPALAALRAALRSRLRKSPLFDFARFARHFGDTLREIWRDRASNSDKPANDRTASPASTLPV